MTNPDSVLQQPTTEAATEEQTPQGETEQSPQSPSDRNEEVTPARNTRFKDILKPEVLDKTQAIVIGVGAIGRQLALQLAAVGVKTLWLIDPEDVEIENLGAQGFFMEDMGKAKVDAVAELCARINDQIVVKTSKTKFRKEFVEGLSREEGDNETRFVIFSCVDDMKARQSIWNVFSTHFMPEDEIPDQLALFIDARMGAEVARVLAVSHIDGKDYYPRTLFEARDGLQQSCTAKTTIYCANLAAAMMMGQFSKWARGILIDKDILYNIFAADLIRDSEEIA